MGEEAGFRGIADLLTDTAIIYDGGKPTTGPIPDDLAAVEHQVREQLVEGIVVGDDAFMERYLEGEALSGAELEATLANGVAQGLVFPVVCGSAVTGVGIDRLATLLAEIAPAPDSRPAGRGPGGRRASRGGLRPGRPTAGPGVQDHLRSLRRQDLAAAGAVGDDPARHRRSPTPAPTPTSGSTCCSSCGARRPSPSTEAQAGDIVAVPKLSDTATGDTLAPKGTPVRRARRRRPEPVVLSVAIRPKSKGDEDKLMTGLHRFRRRTAPSSVERVDETHQTILRGTGETHLAVAARAPATEVRRRGGDRGRPRPVPRDDHADRPRPKASTRSRPGATASTVWPRSASSPSSAARVSTSSTRSWAAPSPSSTSRPWRRASSRP